MNIKHRTRMGFGRDERRCARDQALDRLIEKVETKQRLRFKPAPASWAGRCRTVYNSRSLSNSGGAPQARRTAPEPARVAAGQFARQGWRYAQDISANSRGKAAHRPQANLASQLNRTAPTGARCRSGQHTRRPQFRTTFKHDWPQPNCCCAPNKQGREAYNNRIVHWYPAPARHYPRWHL